MLLVAVLEVCIFKGMEVPPLRINPARGVDLPDLALGVKSPSKNFCTSEPFFSAYERLLGNEHDLLVLLTDYQQAKKKPPLRLKLIESRYLARTQVADRKLCRVARLHRSWLLSEDEAWAQKVFRFLAFVNQSDWRGRKLLDIFGVMRHREQVEAAIDEARLDFATKNKKALRTDTPVIPDDELAALERILNITPIELGVIDALDNWVVTTWKDVGRLPNENEWNRLRTGPLDGMIGMSFALQWRFNFGALFGQSEDAVDDDLS